MVNPLRRGTDGVKKAPGERFAIEAWRWFPAWANLLGMVAMIGASNWMAAWFAFAAATAYASYIHERDFC